MRKELFAKALTKLLLGMVLLGAIIFVAAGTLHYCNGWLLMGALFIPMPMILGSPIATALMLFYIPLIVKRIKHEEELLEQELQGYAEYKLKVRYRLIPYVW